MPKKPVGKKPYKFTTKQQRFIDFYNGNGVQAARDAGYGKDETGMTKEEKKLNYGILAQQAHENLQKPEIASALQEREIKRIGKRILSREELQALWTEFSTNKDVDSSVRMRATELLAKSNALFVERREVSGTLRFEDLLDESRKDD